jgi:hypothetical protein
MNFGVHPFLVTVRARSSGGRLDLAYSQRLLSHHDPPGVQPPPALPSADSTRHAASTLLPVSEEWFHPPQARDPAEAG